APGSVTLQPNLPDCASVVSQPCRRVFVVNRTTDAVDVAPGDGVCATVEGDCSLRAAIQEANATPGEASALLDAARYALSLTGTDDSGGDLDVTDDLMIEGVGATIDAHQLDRVIEVSAGAHLVLDNTTLTGGAVWDSGGGIK